LVCVFSLSLFDSYYLNVASTTNTDFHRASVLLSEHDEKTSSYHHTSLQAEERCKQLEEEMSQLKQSQEKEVKLMKKQIDKLKREILEAGGETEPLEIEISELKSKIMMDEMEHVEAITKLKRAHEEELEQVRIEMKAYSAMSSAMSSSKVTASSSKLADLEKKLGDSEAILRDNAAALEYTSRQAASLREASAQQLDSVTKQEPTVVKAPPKPPPMEEDGLARFRA
jgi:chromosome segregation ATPase